VRPLIFAISDSLTPKSLARNFLSGRMTEVPFSYAFLTNTP
jgi:hypothetical protein